MFKGFMTQKSTVFILFLYGWKYEYKIGLLDLAGKLEEPLKFLSPRFLRLRQVMVLSFDYFVFKVSNLKQKV